MNAIASQAPVFSIRAFKLSSVPLCEDAYIAPLLCDDKLYYTYESGVFEQGDLHESFVHFHVTESGAVSLCFPVSHLLTLDLSGIALDAVRGYENDFGHCDRYSIDFPSYDAALAFLALNYGVTDAPENPTSTTQHTAEPTRTKETKITISMMVEPSLYEEVKRLAELKGRSVGGQIRHAIKQNLRKTEPLLPGAPIHTPTANAPTVIHNGL